MSIKHKNGDKTQMKKFSYKNYTVLVFEHYNGQTMYISDSKGNEVWAHKFQGDARAQAARIIDGQ